MNDLRERLIEERLELDERLVRLTEFLKSSGYDELTSHEQTRLLKQAHIMKQYSDVLYERIMALGEYK